ncbi:PP2C family protein-serine/threonine phosphatase [Jannaschia pohangensis]|uniref:Protein phosphatase n=1 Tax=Jannaschia pohangensis TaxID=390807 RepID=A0A1I3UFF4_9RHOB|nr:protein phosphatase 2C domain-containing protein [Jannaschia pohangensis]SFJ82228.1 protein phosphatase [Jannaschia pohangensis]
MHLIFETGERTDVGLLRKVNEDAALAMPDSGLWVVADGMGGHSAGDVSSRMIVDALASTGLPASAEDLVGRVMDRLSQANTGIREHAATNQLGTIGATVVAFLVQDDGARALWSGDSRLYRLRDGHLDQVTRDHTEVNELLDSGALTPEEAERYPRRNVITRAIGVTELPHVELLEIDVQPGDVWLLCSDGLTEHLQDYEIRHHLAALPPQEACNAMVADVLDRGARDNVTVIAIAASAPEVIAEDADEVPLEGIIPDV